MTRMLGSIITLFVFSITMMSCTSNQSTDGTSASDLDNQSVSSIEGEDSELTKESADLIDEATDSGDDFDDIAALDEEDVFDEEGLDQEFEEAEISDLDDEVSKTSEEAVDQGLVTDELDDSFDEEEVAEEATPLDPLEEDPEKNTVTNLEYKSFSNGGTVVIETSQPAQFQLIQNEDKNQAIIEVENATLPEKFKRPYITKDFKQDIALINAYSDENSGTARFVIQFKKPVTPITQQEGNSILVMTSSSATLAENSLVNTDSADGLSLSAEADLTASVNGETYNKNDMSARVTKGTSKGGFGLDQKSGVQLNNNKFTGSPISLEYVDTDIRTIIETIAAESGINLIMDKEVSGSKSIRLRNVPWDQALIVLLRSEGLGYVKQGNVLRIAKQATLSSEAQAVSKQIQSEKEAQLLTGGLKVKYIPVSYAKVAELSPKVKEFLSKEGKVAFDDRTSSLVITDYSEFIDRVSELVRALDTPPMQVEIESKLVEAREDFSREAGINWDIGGANFDIGRQTGRLGARYAVNNASTSSFSLDLSVGTFDIFGDLEASLNLFESQNKVKVLSQPRIVTMNKTTATIEQITQIPIETVQALGNVAVPNIQFQDLSLSLKVTPQITFKGDVILEVDVKREFPGQEAANGQRELNRRNAKTTVMVKNGQTAVIGGIYQLDDSDLENGIPILKDIPLLGYLFKQTKVEKSKNELLLFIKPKILKETSGPMLSKSGPPGTMETFEEISVDVGENEFENTDFTTDDGLDDPNFDSQVDDSEFDEEFDE